MEDCAQSKLAVAVAQFCRKRLVARIQNPLGWELAFQCDHSFCLCPGGSLGRLSNCRTQSAYHNCRHDMTIVIWERFWEWLFMNSFVPSGC